MEAVQNSTDTPRIDDMTHLTIAVFRDVKFANITAIFSKASFSSLAASSCLYSSGCLSVSILQLIFT